MATQYMKTIYKGLTGVPKLLALDEDGNPMIIPQNWLEAGAWFVVGYYTRGARFEDIIDDINYVRKHDMRLYTYLTGGTQGAGA